MIKDVIYFGKIDTFFFRFFSKLGGVYVENGWVDLYYREFMRDYKKIIFENSMCKGFLSIYICDMIGSYK